jgi:hypothetical protein
MEVDINGYILALLIILIAGDRSGGLWQYTKILHIVGTSKVASNVNNIKYFFDFFSG